MRQQFDLVVTGGNVVTATDSRALDIAITDGVFAAIGDPGAFDTHGTDGPIDPAGTVLDATGLQVLPGVIDAHVHFRDPGYPEKEDFRTGSLAAVMGGVTTVLDMPNTQPPTDSVEHARAKLERARGAWCDIGLLGLVADDPVDQLEAMARDGLVVGFKAFLGPTTGGLPAPSDVRLRGAMSVVEMLGMRLAVHAEDAAIVTRDTARLLASGRTDPLVHPEGRPVEAEVVAIERIGRLAAETGCPVHIVHLSSRQGLDAIERWRSRGADMTCEVSANHLFLGAESMARIGPRMKMNPPVRLWSEGHGEALLDGLVDGRVTMLASDHAPHTAQEKLAGDIWTAHAGAVGVETSLPMVLSRAVASGRLTLQRLVAVTSAEPARVWGLSGRKGAITVGRDADLTIVDPTREQVIDESRLHGRSSLSPFRGELVRGLPVATIVRGRVVMRDGDSIGTPAGAPFGPGVSRPRPRRCGP
jgi:dihydroorotase